MVLDRRILPPNMRQDHEKYSSYFELAHQALRSRDTILVNTTPVAQDLVLMSKKAGSDPTFREHHLIPYPKPPYQTMWLESVAEPQVRFAHLVKRADLNRDQVDAFMKNSPLVYSVKHADMIRTLDQVTIVEVLCWSASRGYVEMEGDFCYWLNPDGEFQESAYGYFGRLPASFRGIEDISRPEFKQISINYQLLYVMEYSVLHTFARMNCHNVKLVPVAGTATAKPNSKKPPSSVWHEIVVTGLPELRRKQDETAPDGEKRELRFHKIRGHYADYTKGKGLFGRLKVRIWIAEHTAGNPDLGTVVGSYKVKEQP
jgi:hypothetical protein